MKITEKLIAPLIYEAGFSEKVPALPESMTAGELSAHVKTKESRFLGN